MRKIFAKKAVSFIAAICLILGAGAAKLVQNQTVQTTAQAKRLPVYAVQTDEKVVALTFDAAWGNSDTDILIELLARYDVKASFFVTGDWCDRYAEDVKKLSDAGHAIENHSDMHPHPNALPGNALVADTKAASEKIYQITGIMPKLYRAPYGEYNDAVLETIEDKVGLMAIQWDADSRDWKRIGAEAAAENVLAKVQNGSIMLFHNDLDTTAQAVEKVITRLLAQGYRFVLVKDMVYTDNYKIDVTGRQILVESRDL